MSKEKKEIVVLYCQQGVADESEAALAAENANGLAVQPVMMPCSSKVQVYQLMKILENGADGIEIVACPEATCKFLVGSKRAEKRVTYVQKLLKAAGVNQERIGITRQAQVSATELIDLARARADAISQNE